MSFPQPGKQNKPAGKKPLPEPTNLGHFVIMLVMKVCRSILFVDTAVKIGVYLIGVMVGSIICDLYAVPRTIFASSKNPLNQYFIKLGWGWTLVFVSAYIGLTSLVYCSHDIRRVCQHLGRLAVGTFWWYFCTKMFMHIENVVGVCTKSNHGSKAACLADGKSWLGFDISGHVFLEIHCLLIISEELKTFKFWRNLEKLLADDDLRSKRNVSEQEVELARTNFDAFTPFIKLIVFCIAIMMVLFEFMLLTTTIYRFHTLSQKVTASFIAVIVWFLSYRVIFRSTNQSEVLPVMPGQCALNFMKMS